MEILLSFDSRCIRLARGCWPFFVAHRTDAGASGETELVLAIPSDKAEDEVKVKSQRAQKGFFGFGAYHKS